MSFALNSTTIIGTISKYGVKCGNDGRASCALQLTELGYDEREHTCYINVEVWGKSGAVEASQLPPGALVLVSGQIRPKKVKDAWTLLVSAREMTLLDGLSTEGDYDTEKTA